MIQKLWIKIKNFFRLTIPKIPAFVAFLADLTVLAGATYALKVFVQSGM